MGIQAANIHTLLKFINALMRIPEKQHGSAPTQDEDTEQAEQPSAACYDLADFFERTDCISQWGPVKEYDDAMVNRFIKCFTVTQDGIVVLFKAGVEVSVGISQ